MSTLEEARDAVINEAREAMRLKKVWRKVPSSLALFDEYNNKLLDLSTAIDHLDEEYARA